MNPLYPDFYEAVKNDDVQKLCNMDFDFLSLNGLFSPGRLTILHVCASHAKVQILRKLLQLRVNVNVTCEKGLTALSYACQEGHSEVVRLLLKAGADVNIGDLNGLQPLSYASRRGCKETVKLLLDAGAELNVIDSEGRRPAEFSFSLGHIETSKLFIEQRDFDILATGSHGCNYLHLVAYGCGSVRIAEMLIDKGADIKFRNKYGSMPIHTAAREGHTELVKFFLSRGCDINERGRDGLSLLHCAVSSGKFELVKFLVESNCHVNAYDDNNVSSLQIACDLDYDLIAVYLIENSAFFDDVIYFCLNKPFTARSLESYIIKIIRFYTSVRCNDPVGILNHIREGVFVNAVSGSYNYTGSNKRGRTALYHAVFQGLSNIVEILIRNGADIMRIYDNGETLLHIASSKNYGHIVEILLKKYPVSQLGEFVNYRIEKNGASALHLAAKNNSLPLVKLLLRHRAFYNIADKFGNKPIDTTGNSRVRILLGLIEGIFEAVENRNVCVINLIKDSLSVVTYDILINVRNKDNKSLLEVAIQHGNKPLADKILQAISKNK